MMTVNKPGRLLFPILTLVSAVGYVWISYFTLRQESLQLLSLYILLFGAYLMLYRLSDRSGMIREGYVLGLFFRILLLFLVPNLSDDIYRFLWDGHLMAAGYNPFLHTPMEYLRPEAPEIPGITRELFLSFGKDTYSSYPPLNQWIFALAVILFPESPFGAMLVIRTIILVFESGNLLLIHILLKKYRLPQIWGLLYALNPLVILELTGNLHFEAMMIFFLLLGILNLESGKWVRGGLALGGAVLSKLIPLAFLPLIWRKYGLRQGFAVILLTGLTVLLAFLPFINREMINGFSDSLGLYFQKFEFNASIYYLVREVGFWITGYNIIGVAGPLLALLAASLIFLYSFRKRAGDVQLAEGLMWVLLIYLALTTTLHPWYITTLLALSVFTTYRFPVVWTLMIFFSYEGYHAGGYRENYLLIFLEYAIVYGWLIWEIKKGLSQVDDRPF